MFCFSWRLFMGKHQNLRDYLIKLGISCQFGLTTAIECLVYFRIMPSIAITSMFVFLGVFYLTLVVNLIAEALIFQWLCKEPVALSPGHIMVVTRVGVMGAAGHGRIQAFSIPKWLLQFLTAKQLHRWLQATVWVEELCSELFLVKPGVLALEVPQTTALNQFLVQ